MEPKLFILIGKGKKESFRLEREKSYTIGRHSDNDIQLKDIHISRFHLRIRFKDNKYYIKDLVTKNGTFICGEEVERGIEVQVEEGVPVVIGMTVIGFGDRFETDCLPFLLITGIYGEIDEDGELIKPFRSMTVRNNLGCIYKVNKALLKSKDRDEIVNIILENIFHLLKRIDRCAVILYDDKKGEIAQVRYRSRREDENPDKSYNRELALKSLALNESVMIRNVSENDYGDDKLTESLRIMKIGSAACVPINTYFHTIGAIYVDSLERPNGFRKNDLALLRDIGSRAALAIDEKDLCRKLI